MTATLRIQSQRGIHYAWYIVLAGSLSIFAALGLGRFALGMILPSMAQSLSLSYSQMGLISTFNFVGYLIAVLVSGPLNKNFGPRRVIFGALSLVGISMLFIGQMNSFLGVLILFMFTGAGSGAATVPTMSLTATWFSKKYRGTASGFVVIGSGFAILLSGKLIPYLNEQYLSDGWRMSWMILGALVIVTAVVCYLLLRDHPDEKGCLPLGEDQFIEHQRAAAPQKKEYKYSTKDVMHLGAIYFLFGFTYVIYVTFFVTNLVNEHGLSEAVAGNYWSWIGILSLLSGPVFGTVSDKLGRSKTLVLVFSVQTCAYFLTATGLPGIFLYISIICFGLVAWSVPSIMAALVADYVGPQKTASIMGVITFILAIGQITGPGLSGMLAEATNSFAGSFYLASFGAAVAVVLSFRLKSR